MITEIRCSSLARYMVCAGYAHLNVAELPSGEPAREGTACGELLQLKIENKIIPNVASNGVFFDRDMQFYTNDLHSNILSRAATQVLCETRIDWMSRGGIMIRGQYDASYVDQRGYLCIDDLKYGWGIVEVKDNWQILGYAIGEIIRRNQAFDHIALRILQPRPHHEDGYIREWVITWNELLHYKERIDARSVELAQGRNDFQTSEKCKYCKGVAEACTAFNRLFYKSIEVSQAFTQDTLTEQEIANQLDIISRASEVIKIKHDSLIQLGTDRIRTGRIIPGYVQVDKFSQREWKPGTTPAAVKLLTGIDITETAMISPAKFEKMKVSKAIMAQLCTSTKSGVKLEKRDSSSVGNKIFGNTQPQIP